MTSTHSTDELRGDYWKQKIHLVSGNSCTTALRLYSVNLVLPYINVFNERADNHPVHRGEGVQFNTLPKILPNFQDIYRATRQDIAQEMEGK